MSKYRKSMSRERSKKVFRNNYKSSNPYSGVLTRGGYRK